MPPFMLELQQSIPDAVRPVVDHVWANKDLFIKWPQEQLLLMPGAVRQPYHQYDAELLGQLRSAGVSADTRSNGPAISAFLFAGGVRPFRANSRKQWSIHHIYDGQFPAHPLTNSIRAVINGDYFTNSAGLVAIHPVADALADENAYFAWLLRYEAFLRFGFDPDNAFAGYSEAA